MVKVRALGAIFLCAFFSLVGMQKYISFVSDSAEAISPSVSSSSLQSEDSRQTAINSFYTRKRDLEKEFAQIAQTIAMVKPDEADARLSAFIAAAEQLGKDGVDSLNRDEFKEWMAPLIQEALTLFFDFKSKKIKKFLEKENFIKKEFNDLIGETLPPDEYKISIVEKLIEEAKVLKSASHYELHEVEFAHSLGKE